MLKKIYNQYYLIYTATIQKIPSRLKPVRLKDIFFNLVIPSFLTIITSTLSFAQSDRALTVKGIIFNSTTKKPIDFATIIILETRVKSHTGLDGSYQISVANKGKYTLIIRSNGMKIMKTKIMIAGDITRNFYLKPQRIKGAELIIIGNRDIQKVSRRTMTVEELKETPASFGDSINALTSQPGVDRTNGFFGPLVIRGMYPDRNRYYIDGMPINNPMHFGGIHSVINNNIMSEIDLYASAFPSQFGGPLSAVININTVDNINRFGGYSDIGIISATALIQSPITRRVIKGDEIKIENAGYFIVSGRYGYLGLIVPRIIEAATDGKIEFSPEYHDYQVKGKYCLNSHHSLSMLLIGSSDRMEFVTKEDAFKEDDAEDILFNDFNLDTDEMFNNLGLYYTYQLDRLKNKLMVYASLSRHYIHLQSGHENIAEWLKNFKQNIYPHIYGIKDDFSLEWWKRRSGLRGNIEYTLYHFTATGMSIIENSSEVGFDPTDNNLMRTEPLDLKFVNHAFGGYFDNKFTVSRFTFVPGIRFDYYLGSKELTIDPRGIISYIFPTDTTISMAGGQYSSHFQLNPYMFSFAPEICDMDYANPEKAYHSVIAVEQEAGLFTIGAELYYNYFKDIAIAYPHYVDEEYRMGLNSAKVKVKGFEIMIQKDKAEGTDDFFGWFSYTYNRSKDKSGITGNRFLKDSVTGDYYESNEKFDPNGNNWLTSNEERKHSLKLVLGYQFKSAHTISCRFQLYTSPAYTPIVDSEETPPGTGRYEPIYSEKINSMHFNPDHRMDVRYTYKTNYEWGYVSWYIEIIDIYGLHFEHSQSEEWAYNKPYKKGDNPYLKKDNTFMPNFGVEVKF